MAALTSPKKTRWTQPCMSAIRPRDGPRAGVTVGSRVKAARAFTSGVSVSSERMRSLGSRSARALTPRRRCSAISGAIARSRPGWVNSSKIARRSARSRSGRSPLRSSCGRVCSISLSYCTPDGHAVTQAMQPRQRSKWVIISGETAPSSS